MKWKTKEHYEVSLKQRVSSLKRLNKTDKPLPKLMKIKRKSE
jgi:hypothetical protein